MADQQKDLPDPGVAKGITKVTFFFVIVICVISGSSLDFYFDMTTRPVGVTESFVSS
jgi:hypothetical protein